MTTDTNLKSYSYLKHLGAKKINIFWFRRDLRLHDNAGLFEALKNENPVLPIFIFDENILNKLNNPMDRRVQFIYKNLQSLKIQLQKMGSDLLVFHGTPLEVFKEIQKSCPLDVVFANHDYEPSAIERDLEIGNFLKSVNRGFRTFKDQCVFEKNEILTDQKKPYTVFTPYKKKWLSTVNEFYLKSYPTENYFFNFLKIRDQFQLLKFESLGFQAQDFVFPKTELNAQLLKDYAAKRDFPAEPTGTSLLGIHLRFGTLSVRELAREGKKFSEVWLSELIWRDFFMQILWHFPHVLQGSFRPQFEKIPWRVNASEFEKWCAGQTGYPLVDAGMRELNATGHMHNRVRMVVASFLTKHLMMHWSLGERYFAKELLDFELSSNNGNWQWAAGTGCDAAPYFRIFNPTSQLEKFDSKLIYVKKWVPEYGTLNYVRPLVEHTFARERTLKVFASVLKGRSE